MARIKDTVIPLADYPTGTRSFGPATISNQAVKVGFEIARCTTAAPDIWPNATTTVEILVEVSLDNGATWTTVGGFGAQGGIHVRRDGAEAAVSSFLSPLPAGNNRRVRGTVTIVNGPLRTSGSVVVLTA